MSENVNLMPFVCKWLDTHSDPQHFKTKEKLRNHIVQHDISSCKGSFRGDTIYICPWKGCNKCQSSIIKLEDHLHRHIQQKPFKCPICNHSRFDSPDALSQHLIMNHNDSIVDSDTDYENEELNLGKFEDKNNVRVKKEVSKDEKDKIIPISNTTKLSYRDVLIKGRVNENKNTEDLKSYEHEKAMWNSSCHDVLIKGKVNENKNAEDLKSYEDEMTMWDLIDKGIEIISLLPESPVNEYDFDNDDLPIAPRGKLTETEEEKLMWKAICENYKDTEAGKYFNKAFEMMESKS
ncbi:4628_t:CDS:2 [Funneliformis caledonium]|uniref:4628_t:CDS:1 n=1 Tax=Funneliformis caledonium TaxID=1117310 RepID=A0A9N9DQD0_9GLOM|nr:4628_t:CDS:2 [Funneliformis caledonium]